MNRSSGVLSHRLVLIISLAVLGSSMGCCATGGWIMNNSGMGYYEAGNYAMAHHEFIHAVDLAPWNPDYRHNLAMSMARMGHVQQAEQMLHQNLSMDVMHQPTYHSLAKLMIESGRQPEAEHLLTTWAGSQPYNAKAHVELAWLQRENGNLPAAEMALRQAIQMEPNNPVALAHLGQLYQDAGEPSRAAAMYQQSLAMNSSQPLVQSRLASLQGTAGPLAAPGGVYNSLPMRTSLSSSGTMIAAHPATPHPNVAMLAGPPVFNGSEMAMASYPQSFPTTMSPQITAWNPTPTAPSTGWNAVAQSIPFDRSIPAGTVQVSPWQWAPAPNATATPTMNSPTPVASAVPQGLAPIPDPQVPNQTVIQTASKPTSVPQSIEIPQLPGVIDSQVVPASSSQMAVPVLDVPTSTGAEWQPVPTAPGVGATTEQVSPAEFEALSTDLQTVEPY